ncbi:MAG: Ig-like domain-containing protein [Nakamurella sp.]
MAIGNEGAAIGNGDNGTVLNLIDPLGRRSWHTGDSRHDVFGRRPGPVCATARLDNFEGSGRGIPDWWLPGQVETVVAAVGNTPYRREGSPRSGSNGPLTMSTTRTWWVRGSARAAVLAAALLGVVSCASGTAPPPAVSPVVPAPVVSARAAGPVAQPTAHLTVPALPAQTTPAAASGPVSAPLASPALKPTRITSTPTAAPVAAPKIIARAPKIIGPAAVTATPAFGATELSPAGGIRIAVTNGKITSLSMVNPAGTPVSGKMSVDGSSWSLSEDLGYAKTYTVTGTAVGSDGKTVPITGTYTTLSPHRVASATISPDNGTVVGAAAPIIVRFSSKPTNRAAIQRRMKVLTTPAVPGSWAWITHDGDTYPSLDWRPKNYWPQYTKVRVEADIYGTAFDAGVYGAADVSTNFNIGRNQVVIANAKAHNIVVQRSGKTVATYPASYGMGDDPNSRFGINPDLVTRSGIHIVMAKLPTVSMSNPKYGYTNSVEHWAVRISNNGEFIHENPHTVTSQGHINVSHGCINLSQSSAIAYYKSAIYGDPVQITGTSVHLSPADGDIYDWALPWPVWQSLSAR